MNLSKRAKRRRARNCKLESLERRELFTADSGLAADQQAVAAVRPNIVVVSTDDHRADGLTFMANVQQDLAARGTTFQNAFVTTALCGASRSSLLTGQYIHNTGVLWNATPLGGFQNFGDTSTIATWLQDAGYRTGLVGKYLNGYDKFSPENADPQNTYVPPGWDEWHAFLGAAYYNFSLSENGVSVPYAGSQNYSTNVLSRKATEFITESSGTGEPFFLYVAPHAPHTPSNPAPGDKGALNGLAPYRPVSFNEADVSDKPAYIRNAPKWTSSQIAQNDATRQLMLESLLSVDRMVGSIVDTLQNTGQLNNTVIIFTSDNGFQFGEHRLTGKVTAYEESIRVPLIISDGRAPVKRTENRMALNIDLASTIAELAGATPALPQDGRSLVPLLQAQTVPWRSDFLIEHFKTGNTAPPHNAIRTADGWKYIEYKTGERELYNLNTDPFELKNLANQSAQANRVSQMRQRLAALKSQDVTAPVVTQVTATQSTVSSGTITFSATVSDSGRGNNQVRTPEFFIDRLGAAGTGNYMQPADGHWNSVTERASFTVPASMVSAGTHKLFVRGRDVAGNWSAPVSITFVKSGAQSATRSAAALASTAPANQPAIAQTAPAQSIPSVPTDVQPVPAAFSNIHQIAAIATAASQNSALRNITSTVASSSDHLELAEFQDFFTTQGRVAARKPTR